MKTFAGLDRQLKGYRKENPCDPPGQDDPLRASRFYSAADLTGRAVKPREWLVEGLIPKKTVTLFSGDGGTGSNRPG